MSSISYPGSPSGNGAISYGGTKQVLYSEIPSVAPHNTLSFQPVALVYVDPPKPYTYTVGISGFGTSGIWGFNGQLGWSWDTKGNRALQYTYSGGASTGTPGGSISIYVMRTNAPSVNELTGEGYQFGGSGGAVGVGGIEQNVLYDRKNDKYYYGNTISGGIGTPGGEVHAEWGYSETIWGYNIYGK